MLQPFKAWLTSFRFSAVLVRPYLVYIYISHAFCKFSVSLRQSNTFKNSNNQKPSISKQHIGLLTGFVHKPTSIDG